jgi:pantoate--beta-alanine ligase
VRVVTTLAELRAARRGLAGPVGVVPTMGYLHAGHVSLIERSRAECPSTLVTLFVNPTQFGPKEDLGRYPRDFERDRATCEAAGVDLLWAPGSLEEMYPPGFSTTVEVGGISRRWEGEHRPGHFAGVATIVAKLLIQTAADRAYFGQKDYQQLRVVTRLARDLDLPTEIVGCETVREPDGLALSSRNVFLTDETRPRALALSRGLRAAQRAYAEGERVGERLEAAILRELRAADLSVDYAAVVDAETLEPLEQVDRPARALVAARLGAVRLIDNVAIPGE